MAGWRDHDGCFEGIGVALPMDGVDTDQIIPARFMSTPREKGYGDYLLHDLRHDGHGNLIECFPLNHQQGAGVMVAGRNFGSGSSREAAVYALVDYGIKAVIAPSFGDIFAANAVNNALLPAKVSAEHSVRLFAAMDAASKSSTFAVNLNACEVRFEALTLPFDIDPVWRTKLLEGWDDIDLTASHAPAIASFRQADLAGRPWAQLAGSS